MPSRRALDRHNLASLRRCGGLLLVAWALASCSGNPTPILSPLVAKTDKTPVIYVPGSTGTELRHRESKKIIWGRGKQLIVPYDGGYSMARSIHLPPFTADSPLEVTRAIEKITVAGIFSQDVYGPIAELLTANGYQRGDLEAPQAAGTAFLFAYDWQLDHRLAAIRLRQRLEALRRARGEERLEVDLICQSNGAYVCRFLLKYGGATAEEIAAGKARPLEWLDVSKLIFLGNSHGGSLRMLREIHRGRRYVNLLGRRIRPEVLFSVPAFFQDLPVVRQDLFLDAEGEPLEVDLFDAETWRRYGWSVFSTETRARLKKAGRDDLFGTEEQQLEYLRQVLAGARNFHAALNRDVEGFGATRYFSIQSRALETPDRAVLVETPEGWETLFTGDKELMRLGGTHARATAEGDGHGTVESQEWLSPQEKAALSAETFYVDADHFELILQPETHQEILEILYGDSPNTGRN